jgi:hypothetical protein
MIDTDARATARLLLLVCAWCAPLDILIGGAGLVIAGALPFPLGPDSPAGKVIGFYSGGAHVPLGFAIASLGFALISPLSAGISHAIQADRTPGSRILAYAQLSGGTCIAVLMPGAMVMMAVAALRPDRAPDITVMLNDLAWLLFITPVGVFIVQNLSIAVYALRSHTSLFPRWFGYLNLWVAFTFSFDGLALIYTRGAFGWNRPLIFWLALTSFTAFLLAAWVVLRRAALSIPADGPETDLTSRALATVPEPARAGISHSAPSTAMETVR